MSEVKETVVANPLVICREEFDDWAILFDPDTGKGFGMNPVGVSIWKLLDGKHSVKDIAANIRYSFQEVPADVESHIRDFLADLIKIGFAGYEV